MSPFKNNAYICHFMSANFPFSFIVVLFSLKIVAQMFHIQQYDDEMPGFGR